MPTIAPRTATRLGDVASEADVVRLFADVKASLGGLDALINNAGVAGQTGGVEDIAPADWRRTIDVCLTGQFLCSHHGVPMLKAAGGGAIVNLSSAAGRFGYAFRTPYSAAKWGVIGLTQSLAKELGPDNIRVNAILPGIDARAELGEGPLWDVAEQRLYWIDSLGAKVHSCDADGGAARTWGVPEHIGSLALREGGGARSSLSETASMCSISSAAPAASSSIPTRASPASA